MTRDEERAKLAAAMGHAMCLYENHTSTDWETYFDEALAVLDAIGAAGYCVVRPIATEEIVDVSSAHWTHPAAFSAMAHAGNLAGPAK